MRLFNRDGFIDRYTGLRLVVPPSLRVISSIIPEDFPFHSNWAKGKCHDSYWDLSATANHLFPVAAGGQDDESNLVSTSMAANIQKNSISMSDLGWNLHPEGDIHQWDGLSKFFVRQCNQDPRLLEHAYMKKWYKVLAEQI